MAKKKVKRKTISRKTSNAKKQSESLAENHFLFAMIEEDYASQQVTLEFEGIRLTNDDDFQYLFQHLYNQFLEKLNQTKELQGLNQQEIEELKTFGVKQAEHIVKMAYLELESKKFAQFTYGVKQPLKCLENHAECQTILDNLEIYYDLEKQKLSQYDGEHELVKLLKNDNSYKPEYIKGFFVLCCNIGNFTAASRLLGRLENSRIDVCVKNYGRALFSFYQGEYSQTVESVNEIPVNHSFYLRAQGLLTECYARMGLSEPLCEQIKLIGINEFTNSTLIKLKILLCQHSEDPEVAHDYFSAMLKPVQGIISPNENDPDRFYLERLIFGELITYSQRLIDYCEYALMASQEGLNILDLTHEFIDHKQNRIVWGIKSTSFESLIITQKNSNLSLKRTVLEQMTSLFNIRRLDNKLAYENMRFLFTIYQTLYNLANYAELIKQINIQYEYLPAPFIKRLSLLVLKDKTSDGSDLKSKLIKRLELAKSQQDVLNAISINAKSSIQLSNQILNQLLQSGRSVDAGIISLGFFRAIETELNEQLLSKFMARLDKTVIIQLISNATVESSWRASWLSAWAQSSKETWHVMLGPAFHFFKTLKRQKDELAIELANSLKQCLTQSGIDHFENGDLQKTIAPEVVTKFRNPPAHSKFLSVSSVVDCREYVNATLSNYLKWFKAYNK